ncbi:MAG: hydrogenase maturation nickel metallochaperone HypA [Actinomycetia bacterium]|nr:hydrogenase maturation nickel metallochaperone HypA [Actinomycetes bacterium]
MSDLVCASCGEEENLRGERVDELITITCEECGLVWDRDLTPRCPTCGRDDVRVAFQAIVEKSRGTQLSIQSMKLVYLCPDCDPELLARWIESNSPLPPDELPTS